MEFAVELLQSLGHAALRLFMNPFTYIGVVFIALQYRRQVQLERKLFHAKLHSWLSETGRTVLWGAAAGLVASAVLLFAGITLQADVVLLLWGISIPLLLLRVRYLCLAYSVGVLGTLHAIVMWMPDLSGVAAVGPLLGIIQQADIPSLLLIVALLHLIEGLLVGLQGARMASPLFVEGKRGKIIGGYQLQGFWPVPLFLLVPLQGGVAEPLPWGTLLGADYAAGWALLAFPAVIGFTEFTASRRPREQVRLSGRMLVLYGVVLGLLAVGAAYWPPLLLAAAPLCFALHEALIGYRKRLEANQTPLYVHADRGLRILAVLPKGPAAELGIEAGEIIHKVNGHRVRSKTDLHYAMQLNSAFCKLEILNLQGEVRFLQRALFAGEHHQLGIILSPDQDALYFLADRPLHLFSYLLSKLSGLLSSKSGTPM